jgi:endoglycosylceramidase
MHIDGARFLDESGRQVTWHGVNVVYKQHPYIPAAVLGDDFQLALTDDDIADLKSWGFNMVRLGVMWEAVETSAGVYNQTYLDEVSALIDRLGKQGVYTLVDMHQDVLSRQICGEGIPSFIAEEYLSSENYCFNSLEDYFLQPLLAHIGVCKKFTSYNYEVDENGWPAIDECNKESFISYYATTESFSLFRGIYQNYNGLQDKFLAYWEVVAAQFANNPYVIGYDPLNEPLPSWDGVEHLLTEVLPTGGFDVNLLQPLYASIYEVLQEPDKNATLWFEPGQMFDWLNLRVGDIQVLEWIRPLGFTEPPGGEIGSKTHVLNDHSYCCQMGIDICNTPTGEPKAEVMDECRDFHNKRIQQRTDDAVKLGVPLFIGEFGSCENTQVCFEEISAVADALDEITSNTAGLGTGYAYW